MTSKESEFEEIIGKEKIMLPICIAWLIIAAILLVQAVFVLRTGETAWFFWGVRPNLRPAHLFLSRILQTAVYVFMGVAMIVISVRLLVRFGFTGIEAWFHRSPVGVWLLAVS